MHTLQKDSQVNRTEPLPISICFNIVIHADYPRNKNHRHTTVKRVIFATQDSIEKTKLYLLVHANWSLHSYFEHEKKLTDLFWTEHVRKQKYRHKHTHKHNTLIWQHTHHTSCWRSELNTFEQNKIRTHTQEQWVKIHASDSLLTMYNFWTHVTNILR